MWQGSSDEPRIIPLPDCDGQSVAGHYGDTMTSLDAQYDLQDCRVLCQAHHVLVSRHLFKVHDPQPTLFSSGPITHIASTH
jgi:hypothetical protein